MMGVQQIDRLLRVFVKVYEKLISVGRVFRILRPIRTLRMINHIDIVISVVEESVDIFLTVSMLLAFLLALFGESQKIPMCCAVH